MKVKRLSLVDGFVFVTCFCLVLLAPVAYPEQGKDKTKTEREWREIWKNNPPPRHFKRRLFRSSITEELFEPGRKVFLAESWPRRMQQFAWREWVYGDHRIQKGEAIYVVRAMFSRKGRHALDQYLLRDPGELKKTEVRDAVKALSGLFYFFASDDGVPEIIIRALARKGDVAPAFAHEIIRKHGLTKADVRKLAQEGHVPPRVAEEFDGKVDVQKLVIDELVRITALPRSDLEKWVGTAQRLRKKWSQRVDSLVREVVHEKGKVIVRKPVLRVLTPYALVQEERLTPGIFRTYMLRNMSSIPYCLDALKFREDSLPYGHMVVDLLEKEKLPAESIEQATELCAYVGLEMWGHFDFADQRKIGIDNSTYKGTYRWNAIAVFFNRLWVLFKLPDYKKAQKDGSLLRFFREGGFDNKWITPNPWLLYRYHGDVLTELVRQMLRKDEEDWSFEDSELFWELESAMAMAQIYDGWIPEKLSQLIRQRTFDANDLNKQKRVLALVSACVKKADLPKLIDLARLGKTTGSSKDKGTKKEVAKRATRIIIGQFDAPEVLRELEEGKNVSEEVSSMAAEALKKNEGEPSSQKNNEGNKEQ